MHRGHTGRYEITVTGGERVQAFVPEPLPPNPPLVLDGPLRSTLEEAAISLGRLDGMSTLLPDRALFVYVYTRKEAVVSSQIEGNQSSPSPFRNRGSPRCSTRQRDRDSRTMSPRSNTAATGSRWGFHFRTG